MAQQRTSPKDLSGEQKSLLRDGRKALVSKKYVKATEIFNKTLKKGDANIIYLYLGRAYQRRGLCDEAALSYDKVADAPKVKKPSPQKVLQTLEQFKGELEAECARVRFICKPESGVDIKINDENPVTCPKTQIWLRPQKYFFKGLHKDKSKDILKEFSPGALEVVEFDFTPKPEPVKEPVSNKDPNSLTQLEDPVVEAKLEPKEDYAAIQWTLIGVGAGLLVTGVILDSVYYARYFGEEASYSWENEGATWQVAAPTSMMIAGGLALGVGIIWMQF